MSDKTFKSHFRVTRGTVEYLILLLGADLSNDGNVGRPPILVLDQVLLCLSLMATPDSYRSVGDRFDVGNGTASRTLWKFEAALYKHLPTFITWPTAIQVQTTAAHIQNRFGFPRVIGAVDGTHIKISTPKENSHNYINRKGIHSIQTQIACDRTLRIFHVYSGEVESVHDARVFGLSGLQDLCTAAYLPGDTHLLGDKAYNLQQHVMVPYKRHGFLDATKVRYNTKHSSARMMVERAIGMLKGRFRSLLDKLPFRRTDLIPYYIVACCILHNIYIQGNDLINIPIIINGNVGPQGPPPQLLNRMMRIIGFNKREQIKNAL